MKLRELGEFALIDRLAEMASGGHQRRLLVGIGDDAAAWQSDASVQLATTDTLVEDVHFTLATTSWEDLGWKSLAANLSDIVVVGGRPEHVLVSLALPGDTAVEDVLSLYRGMIERADEHDTVIIGDDTVSIAEKIVISITALGSAADPDGRILTRAASEVGDRVAVSGALGAAAAGLEMMLGGLSFGPGIEAELRRAFRRPRPRVVEGQRLVSHGVTAAIDVSDGLVADLNHICRASRVGARIERAKDALACPVTVIGDITSGPGETDVVDRQGNPVELAGADWIHFAAGRRS